MNKIFKVIWNHATQSWVATSELSRSKGKTKSLSTAKSALAAAIAVAATSGSAYAAMAVGGAAGTGTVTIGAPTNSGGNPGTLSTGSTKVTGSGKGMAIGENATVYYVHATNAGLMNNANAMAIGTNATANNTDRSVVIGSDATAQDINAVVIGNNATAIKTGTSDLKLRPVTVIGMNALVRNVSTTFPQSIGSTAIGGNALAGLLTPAGATAGAAVSLTDADYATDSGDITAGRLMYRAGIIDATGATVAKLQSNEATAIGVDSRAIGDQAIAIGAQVVAGHSSVAIGGNDMATIAGDANDSVSVANRATYKTITGADLARNNTTASPAWYETTYAKDGSVAIGQKAHANELFSTAIGTSSFVEAGAQLGTAIGTGARVGAQTLNSDANLTATANFTTKGGVAIAAGAVAERDYTTAIGTGAKANQTSATAMGYQALASGVNATAVGAKAVAAAADALAYGGNATAYATNSVAVGTNSTVTATGDSSIAFGTDTSVSGIKTVALGSNIKNVSTDGSVVLGDSSTAVVGTTGASHPVGTVPDAVITSKNGAKVTYGGFKGQPKDAGKYVSIGAVGAERQLKNVAAGNIDANSTDGINGSQLYSIAVTLGDQVFQSTYFHVNNVTNKDTGNSTTNLGNITDAAGATGAYSVTAGVNTTAANEKAVAIGYSATAKGAISNQGSSISIGENSTSWSGGIAMGRDALALGNGLTGLADGAIAIGNEAFVDGGSGSASAAIAIGSGSYAYANATDTAPVIARNGDTVKLGTSTAVGDHAYAGSAGSSAFGQLALADNVSTTAVGLQSNAVGRWSTAVGANSTASLNGTTAMGVNSLAKGEHDIAIGYNSTTTGEGHSTAVGVDTQARFTQATAIGYSAETTGSHSTAVGTTTSAAYLGTAVGGGSSSSAEGSTALGYRSSASGVNSIALGRSANSTATNATSIGRLALATHENAVALGSGAITREATKETQAIVGGVTYGGFAGNAPESVVSFGKVGQERQLVNVAAGNISETSTDAINGSQLYAVYDKAAKPVTFTANTNLDTVNATANYTAKNGLERQLGDTLNIIGATVAVTGLKRNEDAATAGKYSARNIQTIVDDNGVQIQMATNPVFNSTVIGGTFNQDGNQVGKPIVIGTDSNGNNTISNLTTTLPNSTTTVGTLPSNITTTNAATLGDVLNAGWNLQGNGEAKDFVKPYDTVNFANGSGTIVKVETSKDGKTSTIKVDVNTSTLTGNITNTNGTVTVPTGEGDKLANITNVVNAINNSGWKTNSTTATGTATETLVNPGETVNFEAGKNMEVTQNVTKVDGKDVISYTYATKDDVSFNSVQIGGVTKDGKVENPITINSKVEGNTIVNTISNLTTTLPVNTTNGTLPSNITTTNAATLGDVLNAGWNLQGNGEAKDFVKPYDTVNFTNGSGTIAKVETSKDGTTSTIKFDVNVDGKTIIINKDGQLEAKQSPTQVNGENVTGPVNLVNSNTTTVTNTPDGIKVEVNTGNTTVGTDGKAAPATDADANKVATVGDIVNTINNVGWFTNSTTSTKPGTNTKISAGKAVNFEAGLNMEVKQDVDKTGNVTYTYATKENVTFKNTVVNQTLSLGDVTKEGAPVVNMTAVHASTPVGVENGDITPAINMSNATFTGLAPNLPTTTSFANETTPVTQAQNAPTVTSNQTTNAATLGDVLNAGWNLQENGKAKDFVKPYDTVNFVNGTGTTANITTNGNVSNVTYNVNVDNQTTEITYADSNGNTITKNADGSYTDAAGKQYTGPVTSQVSAKTSPLTNNANGTVNTPANPEALATAGDVAKAINDSGFTLTTSESDGDVVGTSEYQVNPGKKVTIDAGKNIKVTQKGGVVSVATKDDVQFSSVKTDEITAGPVTINKDGINAGGTKITNVAPGTISSTSTDAVNGSQLHSLAGDINNKLGDVHNKINRNNKDLRAGIAGANAAAGLPQVYIPGKSMVAASAGTFKGQSAVAVGYSRASDNGKLILKLQGNANTRGDVGGSVGVGYQW